MGLFYAYLQDEQYDYCRYFITFANRETADEWWRVISTSPSPYAANIERISPQFFTQKDGRRNGNTNVVYSFYNASLPDAKRFRRKMIITEVNNDSNQTIDRVILPPTTITDHISGRWYFVRSKGDPWSYWYLRTEGPCLVCGDANCDAIHVSSEYRTKFCVRVRLGDSLQVPEDFVMIAKDEISVTAPMDHTLHISDARALRATAGYQGETDLLFGDLKNRFITRAEKQVNGEIWEYVVPVERGLGETWELVD